MTTIVDLIKQGRNEEAWQRCCGFIDLSLDDFMKIQRRLVREQLELLEECELGRYILNGASPRNPEELRAQVPLTTYEDYAPYLLDRRDDTLPGKPALWQYTSGKSGEYTFRWAPVTTEQLREIELLIFALLFLSSCQRRNEITLKERDKVLYGMAPPPYATGTMAHVFPHSLFDFLPPVEEAEKMSFEERMQGGFELALSEGMDICIALSSVALAIGDRFSQKSNNANVKAMLKRPRVMSRLLRGMVQSKLAHRLLLPKDLWTLKSLITFGMDSSIYKEKIKEMWGREPLEFHGCTEASLIATQTWDHEGMTFIPHLNFFEFIPEKESIRSRQEPAYQPATLLMNELVPGNYELVITSLHGGPFVRYRVGHLIKITALRNEKLNIDIPQMVFLSRVDDQIDIAGFTRLSEKIIWQAIENAGLDYEDWTARKEVKDKPALHLYIELRNNGHVSAEQVANRIHKKLKELDTPYAELESFTSLRPLEVTLLPENTFQRYKQRQQASGADLAELKPCHINPADDTIDFLVNSAGTTTTLAGQKIKV
ncbi:MAG: GH3 auxin-responsive promoter family protein [Dehalococcoidales bacterium]|nr:GH3 auxin-responsive promoter family protein [Dehalococcoidales bacterium]